MGWVLVGFGWVGLCLVGWVGFALGLVGLGLGWIWLGWVWLVGFDWVCLLGLVGLGLVCSVESKNLSSRGKKKKAIVLLLPASPLILIFLFKVWYSSSCTGGLARSESWLFS